jgi:hypothetical protein
MTAHGPRLRGCATNDSSTMTTAPPAKTKRLHLLDAADVAVLYDRPTFTDEERVAYFTPVPMELALMQTFTDPAVQAFFVLQLGYFKAKQRFFSVALDDVRDDLMVINAQLDLGLAPDDLRVMGKNTLLTQCTLIPERFGYRRPRAADRAQAVQVALQSARISPKPQISPAHDLPALHHPAVYPSRLHLSPGGDH